MLLQHANYVTVKSMHITKKTYYFSGVKTFWVIQNNSLPLECIKKINKRKNAKQLSTFDFSTLYTKIPHDKLLDILYKVVDFVFKGGTRDYIRVVHHGHLRKEGITSFLLNHYLKKQ